ncbi:MAG: hypothetical protein ACJAWV_004426 [Flammeovirgaceae bacterium]|jgi:hypothetical protein
MKEEKKRFNWLWVVGWSFLVVGIILSIQYLPSKLYFVIAFAILGSTFIVDFVRTKNKKWRDYLFLSKACLYVSCPFFVLYFPNDSVYLIPICSLLLLIHLGELWFGKK